MTSLDASRRDRTINLGAGPSVLPTDVLLVAAQAIVDYQDAGMGVTEISHRSSAFKAIIDKAEADLRALLDIPDSYAVLFQQGGGTEQFSATALNLLAAHAVRNPDYQSQSAGGAHAQGPPADYAVTGSWSAKAMQEAQRLGIRARAAIDARKLPNANGKFGSIPALSEWNLSKAEDKPAFLYYCDNETVDGIEYASPGFPIDQLPEEYRKTVPLIADCSSNILSRPINIRAHAIVFFGAQKNVGPSGVTVVIVRRDLIVDPDQGVPHGGPRIPVTLVYKNAADNSSLYNTPPMFSIYTSGLVFADLLNKKGGVHGAAERSATKSQLVYKAIDDSQGVYVPTVRQPEVRSRMNVTFRICGPDGTPSDELESAFVKACAEKQIQQVKGHRSVGGIRTSLYNAVTVEQVKVLIDVMDAFAKKELERRKA
ncbi:unnamed protein product [Tilletia controversa]|uniref:phosphoserine transaminase n=3 Tax=Tilletia TaxID=13289 RepID=A0A8X7SY57_9BASI|nr:hypothetical protein CF336_g3007 [Tilletia laevis]KAE8201161.1 hypothetical protein CF328_g2761 [Tilletia controversa]KAE8262548.1 hypothetical protein A4X03_0g2372 [Tilletia caries]KAE8202912.1 hypothetical protein CF335_g3233 [Tilletia laevis]KAE8249001.1 hypothetical protein A4X06_0g3429 [Tilletia controversa]